MESYRIGIDWGGTRIKLGAVTPEGRFLEQAVHTTPLGKEIDEVVDALLERTGQMIELIGRPPAGIGIGLTGPVDPALGVVYLPGKIKGLQNYPVVPRFAERFKVPVTAANDGTVALYAERYAGKARDTDWATVLTIGTGIGSGVLLDGKILEDPYFLFGSQVGHMVLQTGDEPLCLTGARGTGEMTCSATALALAVRSGLQRGIPSTLSDAYFTDPLGIDFRAVIEEGVAKSDALCQDELRRWTTRLGWLLVTAIHAYSSQTVILSGGATLGADYFLPQLQEHVNRHVFRYPPDRSIPVVLSEIREHAGVLGAAMLSLHRHLEK